MSQACAIYEILLYGLNLFDDVPCGILRDLARACADDLHGVESLCTMLGTHAYFSSFLAQPGRLASSSRGRLPNGGGK